MEVPAVGNLGIIALILTGITALVTAMTPILLAMINKKQQVMLVNSEIAKVAAVDTAARVEQVAVKAEENAALVAATTQETGKQMAAIAKVGVDTHTLVNNAMGLQLLSVMELSAFKASTTGLEADKEVARAARAKYEEHVKKQAIVDSGSKQPPPP